MKIVVDAMGGDFAPKVNVDGSIDALREFPDMEIVLVGPQELVEKTIAEYADQQAAASVKDRLTVVYAPEVITTEEHPVMALRRKKNSTFCVGMDMVRRKEAQAFVSAGSTGALMAGSMFKIGRIKGIDRPALAALMPVPGRPMLMVDAGANVDCKPNWIVQFAMMGSVYMQKVMGVETPDVGLLNIGVEDAKGNEQTQNACVLMRKEQPFKFIGSVEARDALAGQCDVLATDGFAGNVLLKNTEGVVSMLFKLLKGGLLSTTKGKVAALLAKDTFKQLKGSFDSTEVGGAPLLGVEGAVVKAHGNSNARAMFCAIRQAKIMVDTGVVELIREGVAKLTVADEKAEA
ncbi:MAG: phosphate acyltransferase PlsX [Clostridia bacterium]|nr:phosphate acyltransferase PlsX [Clostridia bacterium]